jgi:Tfp pilus assembly protein PilW
MQILSLPPERLAGTRAFTLTEAMMGLSIGSFLVAGVLTAYTFSVKGFRAVANYAEIHQAGRHAIDVFSRDMRAVSGISSFSKTNLNVIIPTAFSATGTVISNNVIRYSCRGGALYRLDSQTGANTMLATNLYSTDVFTLYDRVGNTNGVTITTAKGVQVDLKLRKYVISVIQSEDYLSARLEMRNKL